MKKFKAKTATSLITTKFHLFIGMMFGKSSTKIPYFVTNAEKEYIHQCVHTSL
jgi:hypothetical protein